ncbi:PHP domain-containing protein, partial [Elusimicrobiota bacterium]
KALTIYAHPGWINKELETDEQIEELILLGLNGIEAFYFNKDIGFMEHYYELARKNNVLATIGLDTYAVDDGHWEEIIEKQKEYADLIGNADSVHNVFKDVIDQEKTSVMSNAVRMFSESIQKILASMDKGKKWGMYIDGTAGEMLKANLELFEKLDSQGYLDGLVVYPVPGLDLFPAVFARTYRINNARRDQGIAYKMIRRVWGSQADGMIKKIKENTVTNKPMNALDFASYSEINLPEDKPAILILKGFYYRLRNSNVQKDILNRFLRPGDRVIILKQEDKKMLPYLEESGFEVIEQFDPDVPEHFGVKGPDGFKGILQGDYSQNQNIFLQHTQNTIFTRERV